MHAKKFLCFILIFVFFNNCSFALDTEIENVIKAEELKPGGKYYKAEVPDTLDLAERAELAVRGITNFLNKNKNYECYGHGFFNTQKPYLTNVYGGAPNWGKILESLLMMRNISGSKQNLDIQEKTIEGMVKYCKANGSTPTARMMMALMSLEQLHPQPELTEIINQLEESFHTSAKYEDNKAYYFDQYKGDETKLGIIGYGWVQFIQGTALRALTRHYETYKDEKTLELMRKLKNHIISHEYWQGECEPKVIPGHDHGHFSGHHHSYAAAMLGLIWYAQQTNDTHTMQFVRESYEYLRDFGIARIGLFGEMCTTGDMTLIAIKLSDAGVGDYWEDVDCYVRNQLVERQVTSAEKLQKAVESKPYLKRIYPGLPDTIQEEITPDYEPPELDPINETEQDVVNRCVGIWLSDSAYPTHIPKIRLMWVICCTGNCPPALYAAWDRIVQYDDKKDSATVNLLLNRASPWMDINSYLPYQGKVVIKNKKAENISVRIPLWADKSKVKCKINNSNKKFFWTGNYLTITAVKPGRTITIEFPMVTAEEKYTLLWRDDEFWKESINPGSEWKPKEKPNELKLTFKGNTLIDVSPRPDNPVYTLYERNHFKKSKAPMKKTTRFIPDKYIKWE